MKTAFGVVLSSVLLALAGCASDGLPSGPGDPASARLAGNWRQPGSNTPAYYRIDLRGDELRGYTVWKENYGGLLKGEARLEFRAKLNGRRLEGVDNVWAKPRKIEGFVTQDFDEINIRARAGRKGDAVTYRLRRMR